jgi:hypothetical protein
VPDCRVVISVQLLLPKIFPSCSSLSLVLASIATRNGGLSIADAVKGHGMLLH